jgi:FtsP/CotA-like multicopper oxidase with cupredoxin domain
MMKRMNRRSILKAGLISGAASIPLLARPGSARRGRGSGSSAQAALIFGYVPFTQPVVHPERLVRLVGADALNPTPGMYPGRSGNGPIAPTGDFSDVSHGIAPEFGDFKEMMDPKFHPTKISDDHAVEFGLYIEETLHQFVPDGPEVPVFTYRDATKAPGSGKLPGPTVVANYREPAVLRIYNALTGDRGEGDGQVNSTGHAHETSLHLHGGHNTANSDGYPDFYALAGESRDYWYTNCGPQLTVNGVAPVHGDNFDPTWIPTTMWYHDHAMDLTGYNVARGLAGFYLVVDEREEQLANDGVIPTVGGDYDLGLVFADTRFNSDGTIHYDFLDHNGRIGDIQTVNGVVQPYLEVERRKYRFRFLNGSNARTYEIRLSSKQKMAIIGTDSWLLPRAVEAESMEFSSGMRHDVIVDFSEYEDGEDVYLENIMIQTDGRKGKKVDPNKPTPLLQFRVRGDKHHEMPVVDGTVIRGIAGVDVGGQWSPITQDEVVETRYWRFDRSMGAWTINNQFFNPRRSDADTKLGVGAEKWIFENKAGGWWHPIHTHLEGHQVQTIDGELPRRERRYNQDLTLLHGGERAVTLVKQRTFTGPFAMHCHIIEHEDMRMMAAIDPQPAEGTMDAIDDTPPMDGETRIAPEVSGVVPDCIDLEHDHYLFFDVEGDLERLDNRGVGFLECEFDVTLRGNRGREKK